MVASGRDGQWMGSKGFLRGGGDWSETEETWDGRPAVKIGGSAAVQQFTRGRE